MAVGVSAYYHLQCAFNAGEISPEVANQVTLDKYQYALLKAENAIIRPAGPVIKRAGTEYIERPSGTWTYFNGKNQMFTYRDEDGNDFLLITINSGFLIYKDGEFIQLLNILTVFPDWEYYWTQKISVVQSGATLIVTNGKMPPFRILYRANSTEKFVESLFDIDDYFTKDLITIEDANITPSEDSTHTEITLTSDKDIFYGSASLGGIPPKSKLKFLQDIESKSISKTFNSTSTTIETLVVGSSWKIITSGTWKGTLKIQVSYNNGSTWQDYRQYDSNSNFNATESGTVTDKILLRMAYTHSSGSCTATLTSMPYTHETIINVNRIVNAKEAVGSYDDASKRLPNMNASNNYEIGSWNSTYGYPRTVGFFQDRLCFGGTQQQPYMMWMSRTGDYFNKRKKKASGTLTDDSAIAISFVSRSQFTIKHMIASQDLIVFTQGNEWMISGDEVATPTKITPKMQTSRGCSDVVPLSIGNKLIYVESSESVVRDMGYAFESDSYTGNDLTLLAKHLIQNNKIIDATYKQTPDSILYFVMDDGTISCLTYIIEQNVYAWSTIKTDGKFKKICCVRENGKDYIYVLVARTDTDGTEHINLERFANNNITKTNPDDYILLDSSILFENETATNTFTIPNDMHWTGKTVNVVGDGRVYTAVVDSTNHVTITGNVYKARIGLPYTMNLELPNIENRTSDGTMQGREKHISNCILRLSNTLGGYVGRDFEVQDEIQYEELSGVENIKLFSGDKRMSLPMGGFDIEGRITITSASPYPFNLLMAVRVVTFGG